MKKVITYGTFDLFHYGHLNLLKRAKEQGDYLIVGITTEHFDINRGKLNVQQSLMERIQAVKDSGFADEVILEEYEGQKIDDIKKYNIDIFVIGSDWSGQFDYLSEYCEVVYLNRTEGVSSTELREQKQLVALGIIGAGSMVDRFVKETKYVSGVYIKGMFLIEDKETEYQDIHVYSSVDTLLKESDAVYILSPPNERSRYVKQALSRKCHVICEAPIALAEREALELYRYAARQGVVLIDGLKTAYFRGFSRLVLLVKGGAVGKVKSIDVTCTSMKPANQWSYEKAAKGGSMTDWGPFALLTIFKILGLDYKACHFFSYMDEQANVDLFTQMTFVYPHAVANAKVGFGVKSEGSLVIAGTKAYIYVPSPWWKMDYFEVRYENFNDNERYFYKVDGEGLRYELAEFLRLIRTGEENYAVEEQLSETISKVMEEYFTYSDNLDWI